MWLQPSWSRGCAVDFKSRVTAYTSESIVKQALPIITIYAVTELWTRIVW